MKLSFLTSRRARSFLLFFELLLCSVGIAFFGSQLRAAVDAQRPGAALAAVGCAIVCTFAFIRSAQQ